MIENSEMLENYYNGDDWRLFDPNNFNSVINLDIKIVKKYNNYDIYTYTSNENSDLQDQN